MDSRSNIVAKLTDAPGFVKDLSNKAVVNTDGKGLSSYKLRRQKEEDMKNALDDINSLKSELSDIKSLLNQIIQNRNV
jgi:hypothetical protein